MSDSLWPHGLWHTRLPCPTPTSGACSNSCPLSQWCHPTILSSPPPAFNLSQHQGLFQCLPGYVLLNSNFTSFFAVWITLSRVSCHPSTDTGSFLRLHLGRSRTQSSWAWGKLWRMEDIQKEDSGVIEDPVTPIAWVPGCPSAYMACEKLASQIWFEFILEKSWIDL